ncbi:tetratricopeptide repeat protein [Pseudomonas sp.]|uniref:tetratricopeptide repeat protein n=1 Tax=Pseudomonas sp. TaxID=306 RepID=UPI003BB7754F
MSKWLVSALAVTALMSGCASVQRGAIPVVDAGAPVSDDERVASRGSNAAVVQQPQAIPQDSGVVVMVPGGAASSAPIQSFPASSGPIVGSVSSQPSASVVGAPVTAPMTAPGYPSVAPMAPSGIPGGALAADEQLDGPVLALLTTAQQQQGGGDLNGASSSLERAQRIAPREPQVLYRLAEVRLAQGDAAQAEQLARRGLTYASGRPPLQTGLWGLIAQARERQGDPAGAAEARQQAQGGR